jgi:hypothetical protein
MADELQSVPDEALRRDRWLRRWWAAAGLALFAATWKLWTPQVEFPQIPLCAWYRWLPASIDWFACGAILGTLALALGWPDRAGVWAAFAVALSVSLLGDQHRLQPWAWQLLLLSVWWASSRRHDVRLLWHDVRLLVWMTVGIYFWSAVSKLDAMFFESHGQTLVTALFQVLGVRVANWPAAVRWWLAALLPASEWMISLGLLWPQSRRIAWLAAIGLHVGLLLALGPWGLHHRPGVLIWNVAFIGHIWLLFGRRWSVPTLTLAEAIRQSGRFENIVRSAIVFAVCLWPISERWGLCDRWLAWSVYSGRGEQVRVALTKLGWQRLPPAAQPLAIDGELRLDRWSLVALDVPIYPQLRFQLGAVDWLCQRCGCENIVEITVHRAVGGLERLTVAELDELRRTFRINTRPRPSSADST